MTESDLMRAIMIALSAEGHFVARANVGLFYTRDGRPVRSGLPVGFSDLFGMTSCGRFFAIEVKTKTGRLRPEQEKFLRAMDARGGVAFVARSVEEAVYEMQKRTAARRVQLARDGKDQFVVQELRKGGGADFAGKEEGGASLSDGD